MGIRARPAQKKCTQLTPTFGSSSQAIAALPLYPGFPALSSQDMKPEWWLSIDKSRGSGRALLSGLLVVGNIDTGQ